MERSTAHKSRWRTRSSINRQPLSPSHESCHQVRYCDLRLGQTRLLRLQWWFAGTVEYGKPKYAKYAIAKLTDIWQYFILNVRYQILLCTEVLRVSKLVNKLTTSLSSSHQGNTGRVRDYQLYVILSFLIRYKSINMSLIRKFFMKPIRLQSVSEIYST